MTIEQIKYRKSLFEKRSLQVKNRDTRIITNNIKEVNGCWEWQKALNYRGYGRTRFKGDEWRAHRLSYFLFKGSFNPELLVCHTCDNPKCCNPDHLFLGDNFDNMRDCSKKRRFKKQRDKDAGLPVGFSWY